MSLLAVPGAAAGRAKLCDDVAKLRKVIADLCWVIRHRTMRVGISCRPLITALNPPQRTVRAELGNFAGRFLADVDRDGNHGDKCAAKNERNQPGRYVSDAQSLVKRDKIVNRRVRVQKYFHYPGHQDENENEDVIAFQPAPRSEERRVGKESGAKCAKRY